jgi:thymidylate synthase (FAD)
METSRVTNQYLEDNLETEFKCLDHGFVRVVDYMGDESSIVQAARVSYGTGTKSVSEDKNLIRYLLRQGHSTPFEMVEIKFHMKLPIFVARQFIRHRMASVNEYSARYSILDKEFYIPKLQDIQPQSTDNKQGRSGELTEKQANEVKEILLENSNNAYWKYEVLLGEKKGDSKFSYHEDYNNTFYDEKFPGIAREMARMVLPVNYYTQWYWKVDGNNLLKMLKLRNDKHAQKEIRVYAEAMTEILSGWMPNVFDAWVDYMAESYTLSKQMIEALRKYMTVEDFEDELKSHKDISKREKEELINLLKGN